MIKKINNNPLRQCVKYKQNPYPSIAPEIISLNSYQGNQTINNTVYVNGLNFASDSYVLFNGIKCVTFYNDPTNLFFYVPYGYPIGVYSVVIVSIGIMSNSVDYEIVV